MLSGVPGVSPDITTVALLPIASIQALLVLVLEQPVQLLEITMLELS